MSWFRYCLQKCIDGLKVIALLIVVCPVLLIVAQSGSAADRTHLRPIYLSGPDGRQITGAAVSFVERIRGQGWLPVIVGLRFELRADGKLSENEAAAQSAALETMQSRVVARSLGRDASAIKRYSFIPFMAMTVDEQRFRKLLADPDVASIEEDGLSTPLLSDTIPLIHATELQKKYGAVGKGQVVAVIDSGVAKSHPMLAGKVVSEACYSSTNTSAGTTSFCPKGVQASTAKGSGVNCPVKFSACVHGTHVASIAAGGPVGTLRGVASGAGIIAIQVMSKASTAAICGTANRTPCVFMYASDFLSALDRVYALRNKFKIAAVNVSLKNGSHGSACDDAFPAQTAAVAKLLQAEIAVVAASGNDASDTDIASPACLSGVVAVAASTKADKVKQVEYYTKFASLNAQVSLVAPGDQVLAAVPNGASCAKKGNSYCKISGTSMAAPHVAGAFAVLKGAVPGASIGDIRRALECSGKMVELSGDASDPYRRAKPRIDLIGAYNWLKRIPKRAWDFNTGAQALDWSPVFADWTVSNGQYHPNPPASFSGYAMSAVANCANLIDISVDMTRKTALGSEFDYRPSYGVLIRAKFNEMTRAPSGYMFLVTHFPKDPNPQARTAYRIYRLDDNHWSLVNSANGSGPAKFNAQNAIRVTSNDSEHKFYVNGKLVLTAVNDGIYQLGKIAVYSDFNMTVPTAAGSFNVNNFSVTSKDPAP